MVERRGFQHAVILPAPLCAGQTQLPARAAITVSRMERCYVHSLRRLRLLRARGNTYDRRLVLQFTFNDFLRLPGARGAATARIDRSACVTQAGGYGHPCFSAAPAAPAS